MTATLYTTDIRPIRTVRNLGWLLRNARQARTIMVDAGEDGPRLRVYMDHENTPSRAYLYETSFASARILWDWLDRPILRGVPMQWGAGVVGYVGQLGAFPGEPLPRAP